MHHRHDISDRLWEKIKSVLPGSEGKRGRPGRDNRKFINAVFWILRTGAPWRDLPQDYGDWKNTHRRFCRWRDNRIWERVLEVVSDEHDCEWIMVDATFIKSHMHSAGTRGGNQDMSVSKGGSTVRYIWPWMRMLCQSERLLQTVPLQIVHNLSN